MKFFLQEAARDIHAKYGDQCAENCLVFPNRRSGLFFKKYLAGTLLKPAWAPNILTISDLMQQLSSLQKADQLSLVFMLYQVYKKEAKSMESFDDFYHWGEMILQDFDDIDKYLVDPRDLFRNLANLKSLEQQFQYLSDNQLKAIRQFWDTLNISQLSKEQSDFLSIWQILYDVYFQFNQLLDGKKQAYEGKIYRAVNDRINSQTLDIQYNNYIFIGFNALTPTEKKLFSALKTQGKAVFYWDYDNYYLEDHEAGSFISKNLKTFPGENLDIYDHFKESKHIRLINTPYNIAQAKLLPRLLKDMQIQIDGKPDKLAIVLPDEHLLLPVLNSLPDYLKDVNVTMGYPVHITPAYSFLLCLINLQINAKIKNKLVQFYYKDVLSIMNHQYLSVIKDDAADELIKQIQQHNKIYLSPDELSINSLFRSIFSHHNTNQSLSEYILDNYYRFYLLLQDHTGENDQSSSIELESIYYVYLSVKRLQEIFDQQEAQLKPETYLSILDRVIQNQRIPFQGEPLSGIQIMGTLETRALDFENLIILSMNEGTFPKAEASNSLIPFNLRKGFGLPTYEHEDAIYAYYFYRLIQRAKNITIVYHSGTEGINTGEMSRFMYQLKFETAFSIAEQTAVSPIGVPKTNQIAITKTPKVLDLLEEYNILKQGSRTLSPSALITYLRCALQFYYKYIARIKEPEEVTEDIDLPLFGSLLHKVVHLLYDPYRINKEHITTGILKMIEKQDDLINEKIMQAFREVYFKDMTTTGHLELSGKNLLIKDIIYQYVKQFLKVEQHFAPFLPITLEASYQTRLQFTMQGQNKQVTLKGDIDRVDKQDSKLRIIDYKTGQPKTNFKDMPSLFEKNGNHAALQALIYCRMYHETQTPDGDVHPGLYFFRRIYQENFDCAITMNKQPFSYKMVKADLDEHLQYILSEIFDPEQSFVQTDDLNTCRLCPYAKICRRD